MSQNIKSFGFYSPPSWVSVLLKIIHSLPANSFGRKLGLILRKPILFSQKIIDFTVLGIKLRTYLKDNVSERKFLTTPHLFDPYERNLIENYFKNLSTSSPVFIDIGANTGVYSLWTAKVLHGKGRVLSFEPNPLVFERLQYNCSLNNFGTLITPYKIALSPKMGTIDFYISQKNLGECSNIPIPSAVKISVPTKPLLKILEENKIKKIDILKIDVEGSESSILLDFFRKAPPSLFPRILIIENSISQELIDYLEKIKYKLQKHTKMNLIFEFSE